MHKILPNCNVLTNADTHGLVLAYRIADQQKISLLVMPMVIVVGDGDIM